MALSRKEVRYLRAFVREIHREGSDGWLDYDKAGRLSGGNPEGGQLAQRLVGLTYLVQHQRRPERFRITQLGEQTLSELEESNRGPLEEEQSMMKVFICWVGPQSHKVALALLEWIPTVLSFVEPFVSSKNIRKGKRWFTEIAKKLEETKYGIVCVVPGNPKSPWLNFEAGALSKSLEDSQVAPFLLGLTDSDLPDTLRQFQATAYKKDDMKKLIESLNDVAGPEKLASDKLNANFKVSWGWLKKELDNILQEIRASKADKPPVPVTATTTKPPQSPRLDDAQMKILQLLVQRDDQSAYTSELTRYLRVKIGVVRYHLERLEESRYIFLQAGPVSGVAQATLTGEGRKFLADSGVLL